MDKEWEIDPLGLKIIQWYLTDLIGAQEKVRDILRNLIQLYGTHAKTAKALNIIRQTLTYRLNHAKVIHLEDALKMLALLQSKKSEPEVWNDFMEMVVFSEQVQMAADDLEKSRPPRGRKPSKKSKENNLIWQNSSKHFVKLNIKTVRLEEEIAVRYGLGNRETLRQAVIVREKGCPALIQALNDNQIKINKAFLFSAYPFEVQEQLVQQELLKRKNKTHRMRVKSESNDYIKLLHTFKTDELLNRMEKKTKEPITKRIEEILHDFFMNQENHRHASLF